MAGYLLHVAFHGLPYAGALLGRLQFCDVIFCDHLCLSSAAWIPVAGRVRTDRAQTGYRPDRLWSRSGQPHATPHNAIYFESVGELIEIKCAPL